MPPANDYSRLDERLIGLKEILERVEEQLDDRNDRLASLEVSHALLAQKTDSWIAESRVDRNELRSIVDDLRTYHNKELGANGVRRWAGNVVVGITSSVLTAILVAIALRGF
jgi:hypothetical protein